MNVEFDAFDLVEITLFAERIHVVKMATKAKSNKYAKDKSEFELTYVGAMAEKAVSKAYNVPMNRAVHIGGDNGTDVVINGYRCEIKGTTFTGPDPHIFIDGMHVFKADVLISVQILSPVKARIIGFINRDDFIRDSDTINFGYGDRLYVKPDHMDSIDVLLTNQPGSAPIAKPVPALNVPDDDFGGLF